MCYLQGGWEGGCVHVWLDMGVLQEYMCPVLVYKPLLTIVVQYVLSGGNG